MWTLVLCIFCCKKNITNLCHGSCNDKEAGAYFSFTVLNGPIENIIVFLSYQKNTIIGHVGATPSVFVGG